MALSMQELRTPLRLALPRPERNLLTVSPEGDDQISTPVYRRIL